MQHARSGNFVAVRLKAPEPVHESLCEIARHYGFSSAYVISGIGMLADPSIGYYDLPGQQYHEETIPGNHELLCLAGNISLRDGELMGHLHVTLSREDHSAFGGHLFGAKVGLTCEVLLAVLDPVQMWRQLEPEFGLPGLMIDPPKEAGD
ncbi:DNA-binding protein [bacterium]|nr:DNA-binding protein [bacterium]